MSDNTIKHNPESAVLPTELWVQVISFLPRADLGAALCTCKTLSSLGEEVWKAVCHRRWPSWALVADGGDAKWRRVYEYLELRESESAILPDVEAIRKRQTVINERHRGILTEWLYEVSHEWDLDSRIVFEAVKILDCYLTHAVVETLASFQLVGLACLRVAMREFKPTKSAIAQVPENSLEASIFAHISANSYTSEQVEDMTTIISALVPSSLNEYPNAKMHLRSLWFRGVSQSKVVPDQDLHIYSLASFLLQLSLLDLSCSACAPSRLAAAALSLSMTVFNKPAWPRALEAYGSYTLEQLQPLRHKLASIQASVTASQLRRCWTMDYGLQDSEQNNAWKQAISVFKCPSNTLLTILGNQIEDAATVEAVEAVVEAEVAIAPAAGISDLEEEDTEVEIIEVDDDTSSASTNSAVDGDTFLASVPMSPAQGESGSLLEDENIHIEILASPLEEEEESEEEEVVPMSLVKETAPRGFLAVALSSPQGQ